MQLEKIDRVLSMYKAATLRKVVIALMALLGLLFSNFVFYVTQDQSGFFWFGLISFGCFAVSICMLCINDTYYDICESLGEKTGEDLDG